MLRSMSDFASLLVASFSGADRSSAALLRVECTEITSEDASLALGTGFLPHKAIMVLLVAAMWVPRLVLGSLAVPRQRQL